MITSKIKIRSKWCSPQFKRIAHFLSAEFAKVRSWQCYGAPNFSLWKSCVRRAVPEQKQNMQITLP